MDAVPRPVTHEAVRARLDATRRQVYFRFPRERDEGEVEEFAIVRRTTGSYKLPKLKITPQLGYVR